MSQLPNPSIQATRLALQADPTNAQKWSRYIEALVRAGDMHDARKMLELALKKGLATELVATLEARFFASSAPIVRRVGLEASLPTEAEEMALARMLQAQQYVQAETAARAIAERFPDSAFGWSGLGVALSAQGRLVEALQPYRRAVTLAPHQAAEQFSLGKLLNALRRPVEAEAHLRASVEFAPHFAHSHYALGVSLFAQANYTDAEKSFRSACSLESEVVEAHFHLGVIHQMFGRWAAAEASFRKVLSLNPNFPHATEKLGIALHSMGQFLEAAQLLQKLVEREPRNDTAHANLGASLHELKRFEEAEIHLREAISLQPEHAEPFNNLGITLLGMWRYSEAVSAFRRAIALQPNLVEAHYNLGIPLQHLGAFDEAEAAYTQVVALSPERSYARGAFLFIRNYHPDKTAEEIYAAYSENERQVGVPLRAGWRPHNNAALHILSGSPPRRLRIGYVSPDLREHSVRHFLEPLLASHDHSRFEVFAYAQLAYEDETTVRYRSHCDHFILTSGMSDEALAERIRADAIDVLIDVAGHTVGNRLLVFARKPAPVSLSWLGYGYTTGLKAIDYLLTDEASAPVGSEHLFSETPWRLSSTPYVYRPDPAMGEVSPLAALSNGFVTFGTLTRAIRINHRTVRVWSEILKRVPHSRLVIDSQNFQHASMQEMMAQRFTDAGIERQRLLIGCHSPPWDTLRAMDIGLDCFPHNSGTTLFESLYMGVPYVTLAGRPSVGRLGQSILSGLNQPHWLDAWCAASEQDYIDKAVALACDLPSLALIRARLRPAMQASSLMDEPGFATRVEQAYLQMFELWQQSRGPLPTSPDARRMEQVAFEGMTPGSAPPDALNPARERLTELFDAGHYERAEAAALEILSHAQEDTTTRLILSRVLRAMRRPEEALTELAVVLQRTPSSFDARLEAANLLNQLGDHKSAMQSARDALRLRGSDARAHLELALAQQGNGAVADALATLQNVLALEPENATALAGSGALLHDDGHAEDAAKWLTRAMQVDPTNGEVHRRLGSIFFQSLNEPVKAEHHLRRAIQLAPADFLAHWLLALLLAQSERVDEAIEESRLALESEAGNAACWSDLSNMLSIANRFEPALDAAWRAISLDPVAAAPRHAAGTALQSLGKFDDSEREYRQALHLNPGMVAARNGLLFQQNYHPDKPPEEIYQAYEAYEGQFGAPLRAQWQPHRNAPLISPAGTPRRLRIGYVSPDLRQHSVRHFLEPLLASHDHSRFEVFCYAELAREDAATARYRTCCDHFILTRGMSDEALACRIRADAIDVLIDVAGHTAGNRLLVFARKPAPVSLSWLGYGYTTGLKAIDYLLTDEASAPVGSEHLFSETPWRLSSTPYVYRPDPAMGEVSPLAALSNGFVTFGTLTRAIRINHRTVRVWSEILKRVPHSRLVIDSQNFQHASMQEMMAQRFTDAGIERQRLLIGCHSPPWDTLRAMDIGLDCFPHNSGTTLFESLYMGVPYVTLAGRPSVGRLGQSILSGLNQPHWLDAWCAASEQDYIDKAVALASDLPSLALIRARLRPAMQASSLMDEPGFATRVEQAYLQMFERWESTSNTAPHERPAQ